MKVPHCQDCKSVKLVSSIYKSFYCEHDPEKDYMFISVDHLPKTSPQWCPEREANRKEQ
jgi:hypothetical protein